MKCVAFLTVFLLISSAEMSTGYRTVSGNNVSITNDLFKIFFILSPIEEKRQILNQFTLEEFVDFTQVAEYQEYMSLAAEIFGNLYENLLVICRDYWDNDKDTDYVIEKNEITFHNITTLSTFFKSFNQHITNFLFKFSSDVKNEAMFDSLRANCAATLKRFEMQLNRERDFNLFSGLTFPNVNEIIFKYCRIGNQTVDLQQVFPNVRRLTIRSTEYTSWFDKLLSSSQLTHISVDIGPKWNFPEEVTIKILENNREIKNLGIYNATPSLLRHINSHHPQIESLTLGHVSTEFEGVNDICMQSVTKFSFDGIVHFHVPITFSKLHELQWYSKPMPDDGLLDFIGKHKDTIESLVIDGTRLNETHFEKMQQLKELKKISLNYEGKTEVSEKINGLIKLVQANPKLVVLRFRGAEKNERLLKDFKASGLEGWVESFEQHSRDEGDICLVKQQILRYQVD